MQRELERGTCRPLPRSSAEPHQSPQRSRTGGRDPRPPGAAEATDGASPRSTSRTAAPSASTREPGAHAPSPPESPYARGRSCRLSTCSAGSGRRGPDSSLLAVERATPVAAWTWSRIRALSVLDALPYASRSLFVTCLHALKSILPSIRQASAIRRDTRSKCVRHQPQARAQSS